MFPEYFLILWGSPVLKNVLNKVRQSFARFARADLWELITFQYLSNPFRYALHHLFR